MSNWKTIVIGWYSTGLMGCKIQQQWRDMYIHTHTNSWIFYACSGTAGRHRLNTNACDTLSYLLLVGWLVDDGDAVVVAFATAADGCSQPRKPNTKTNDSINWHFDVRHDLTAQWMFLLHTQSSSHCCCW